MKHTLGTCKYAGLEYMYVKHLGELLGLNWRFLISYQLQWSSFVVILNDILMQKLLQFIAMTSLDQKESFQRLLLLY